MTRKSIIVLGIVLVLVVAGVFTVAAQSDTTTPTCPGMMQGGHGMMGGGFGNGMMMGADEDTMMAIAAKVLGLESAALVDKLHSGQTLAEIAKARDVEVQEVYDAMFAQAKEHMATGVAAGTMTQAQADAHLTWMRDNIAQMPMFAGGGFGACIGHKGNAGHGMGMIGHGMMGHGYRMMGNNS